LNCFDPHDAILISEITMKLLWAWSYTTPFILLKTERPGDDL